MNRREMIISRLVKATYMGFILSSKSNEYLDKEYRATKEDIQSFIKKFNEHTDISFNRIDVEECHSLRLKGCYVMRTIGLSISLIGEEINIFHTSVEDKINKNLELARTPQQDIQIYDLNTFDLLSRHSVNTMGKKYLASNHTRYMVNFIHLYSVAKG